MLLLVWLQVVRWLLKHWKSARSLRETHKTVAWGESLNLLTYLYAFRGGAISRRTVWSITVALCLHIKTKRNIACCRLQSSVKLCGSMTVIGMALIGSDHISEP